MKKLCVLPLAAAALVLAACSSEKPGSASPAPSAPPAQSSASSAAPTSGGDTASIDPCSLVSAADLASYGTFKPPTNENAGGARLCTLNKEAATASETLSIGVGVRDTQGLDTVSDSGNGKTTGNVNGRKAVLAPRPPGGCLMALELGPAARVDLLVAADDAEKACGIAEKVADIVEPKLPKG
ncbi:DUF3558 domain-containing protein [Amycolatopsis sp. WAC 04182]|uniref:DUF3558 family protein n=1 Tax=Amycolatopsis sp. WAC 04182 TaxID=2203198 RepID=UPI000F798C70|nr:DUF3558 family protein [Amycolatopsis sp. WAC 04182]RSN58653.1 DUF3558 domain-containing protein [Amycolatopsis sp. WAC 04182]